MSKFHIKKNGTPGICKAIHNCPLGGDDEHFDTVEKAQEYADSINQEKTRATIDDVPLNPRITKVTYNKLQKFANNYNKPLAYKGMDNDSITVIPNSEINKLYSSIPNDPQVKQIIDYTLDYETLKKFNYNTNDALRYMVLKSEGIDATGKIGDENQLLYNSYIPELKYNNTSTTKGILATYVSHKTGEKANLGISTDRIKYAQMLRNNYDGKIEDDKPKIKLKENETLAKMKILDTRSNYFMDAFPYEQTSKKYDVEIEIENKKYNITLTNKKALQEITKKSGYDGGVRSLSKTKNYEFGILKTKDENGNDVYVLDVEDEYNFSNLIIQKEK